MQVFTDMMRNNNHTVEEMAPLKTVEDFPVVRESPAGTFDVYIPNLDCLVKRP
jgi:hypothetical protein